MYSKRDFQRRRQLVHQALGARPGERILDIGCGPGFYVAELADLVGAGGAVVGIDPSADMLRLATKRCEGDANVTFHEGPATSLPMSDASFDAALSVQVLEFVEDVDGALAEMHRILRPGGRLVVWDVDWSTVSWHSADAPRMARVLRAWEGHVSHPALPRTLVAQLRSARFEGITAEGHAFGTTEFTPESYGVSILPLITDTTWRTTMRRRRRRRTRGQPSSASSANSGSSFSPASSSASKRPALDMRRHLP